MTMRYDVMSHADERRSAPRSRAMSGSATTIIVEFSGTSRLPSAIANTNAGMRGIKRMTGAAPAPGGGHLSPA